MKKTNQSIFRLSILSSALLATFGGAWAADEVTEFSKPDSSVSIGIGNWSGDRPQQGTFDGMNQQGAYGLFDANVSRRNDETGTWYKFDGKNLGLESREFRIDLERQGDVGGYFEYNKTPRDFPFVVNTGTQGLGTTSQVVGGSGANAFANKGNTQLGIVREAMGLGFFKNLGKGLDFKLSFKNEDKEGSRPWNWYGSQVSFLAEPINSTTRQLEALLQYSGKSLQLSGGYNGSWFDQNTAGLVTARVNGPLSASNPNYITQPLSNSAHQLFLDGGYNFTATTRGTFKASYTKAIQDERLPTADVATPNFNLPNARTSLDGRVDTTLLQFGLTSRPIKDLSVVANLRYHDVDDKTPLALYTNSGTSVRYNSPLSYTKTSGKLEATYRLPQDFKLTGGVEYYNQNRTVPTYNQIPAGAGLVVQFRSKMDETTYKLQLGRSLADTVNGSVAYLRSDRSGARYSAATISNNSPNPADGIAVQNSYNPFQIADRIRDKVRFKLDWDPAEQLAFQFTVDESRDDYGPDNNPYGLSAGKNSLYSVDANYKINDSWKLNGWISQELTRSNMASPTSTAANPTINRTNLSEVTNTFGVGLKGKLSAQLALGADLEWTATKSGYLQSVGTSQLPDINSTLTRFKLNGTYALAKNQDIRLDYMHERWNSNDWTWSFANGNAFSYADGTTIYVTPKQANNFVAARYIYKFQ